jgi:hypothetical protein
VNKIFGLLLALLAFPLAAAQPTLLGRYEATRQALLKGSMADVQKSAAAIAADARAAQHEAIAKSADDLVVAKKEDVNEKFAALSDQMIKVFGTGKEGFVVGFCPMEKKAWLQPKGEVSNPYVDEAMRTCGTTK